MVCGNPEVTSAETNLTRSIGMYLVVTMRLFRLLYARLQAGRRTLYLFAIAVFNLSSITIVRMAFNHLISSR